MFHSSSDRPISPPYYVTNSKQIINNGTTLIPRFASGKFSPPILQAAGQFRQPPPPPFLPLNQSLPPNYFSPHYLHHHQYRQPPLLPLPISKPQSNTKTRSDPPFTRKKSKKKSKNPGKEENLKSDNTKVLSPGQVVKDLSTSNPLLGLPKHPLPNNNVSRNVSTTSVRCVKEIEEQYDVVEKFSGGRDRAVFTLSPPPSSLPLPTFSLRPKLRCTAPAAGIDSGAT